MRQKKTTMTKGQILKATQKALSRAHADRETLQHAITTLLLAQIVYATYFAEIPVGLQEAVQSWVEAELAAKGHLSVHESRESLVQMVTEYKAKGESNV